MFTWTIEHKNCESSHSGDRTWWGMGTEDVGKLGSTETEHTLLPVRKNQGGTLHSVVVVTIAVGIL